MGRRARGLSAAFVSKAKPGRYGDGDGLFLLVRDAGRYWVFRYTRDGRMREMGLGPVRLTPLAEVRDIARNLFKLHRSGRDPLADKQAHSRAQVISAARSKTFSEARAAYIEAHEAGWKNDKHAQQWTNSLATYAEPLIGDLRCDAITTEDVLDVLRPLWDSKKVETGSRVRGRIESILDYAATRGWRDDTIQNPARWKGHLEHSLQAKAKVRKVQNFKAVPIDDLPAVYARLAEAAGNAAKAARFCILTTVRPGNAINARWEHIDFDSATWAIPAEEMKRDVAHRVPLSKEALLILQSMERQEDNPYVFPGGVIGHPLSLNALSKALGAAGGEDATMHGTARSTFEDWRAERTSYSPVLGDLQLAHREKNKTAAAYRRTDQLEQRRPMLTDWATFLTCPAEARGKVVPMRKKA